MESPKTLPTEPNLATMILRHLSILRRYWRLLFSVTVVVTGLTVGFCILSIWLPPERSPLPNVYRAQAVLLIEQQEGSDLATTIMSALGFEQRTMPSAAGFDTGAFIIRILGSRTLLDMIASEMDLATRYRITENVKSRTRALLLDKMHFDFDRSTGAITITCEDPDPVFARDVVNRMVSLLDEWYRQNRGSAKIRQRQLLEEKVNEVKADITKLENSLKALQKKYGVLTAEDLGTTQAASLADLRSQLILREIEIKNYSSFSLVDDARLQQLKEERQNILDLIDQIQKGMPESPASTDTTPTTTTTLPDVAQQFTQLTLELDIQRRIYNTLSPQYEASKLTSESESIFQVLEMAEIPDMKSGPDRKRIVIVAFIGSLGGSIALAFMLNALAQARKARGTTAS